MPRVLDDTTSPHRRRPRSECRERQQRARLRGRRQNEIAEPILRPDEFSNDGADHCQAMATFSPTIMKAIVAGIQILMNVKYITDSASGMLIAIDSAKHCKVT